MRDSQVILRRLAIVGVCVVSLVGAVGLAWWQWTRYESASGTLQNLGYVLQWPLFGLFPAFMFWRLRKLRREHEERAGAEPAPSEAPTAPNPRQEPDPVTVRDQVVASEPEHDDEDPELAEYNRYLKKLHAKHQQETR